MTQLQQSQFYEASGVFSYVNTPPWGSKRGKRLPFIRYDVSKLELLINKRRDVLIVLASTHELEVSNWPTFYAEKYAEDTIGAGNYPHSHQLYLKVRQLEPSIVMNDTWMNKLSKRPKEERLAIVSTIFSNKEREEILDTYKKDLDIFIKSTIEYNMSFYSFKQLSRDNMNFVDLSNVEERFLEFFEINEEDVKRLF